ncbi:MAG TPA: ABC transporter permease, partial [Gemmatimonadales bacterium]|nr:ABC transporter permease [Gemmatimonadales bacterium]
MVRTPLRRGLPGFALDLPRALRGLARRPLFVASVLVTLALGIGADVAVFSVVYAILLRPLPYSAPDRLVALWPDRALANQELDHLRRESRSYSDIAAFSPGWLLALTGEGSPEQLNGARVSGNMFRMLGAAPLIGRTFGPETDTPGNDRVVVLGYRLWQTVFRGDTAVIGRSI